MGRGGRVYGHVVWVRCVGRAVQKRRGHACLIRLRLRSVKRGSTRQREKSMSKQKQMVLEEGLGRDWAFGRVWLWFQGRMQLACAIPTDT